MRLFPVVSSGTVRITYNPITLGGYHIPAGQPILIPFWTIHRSPKLWANPESFEPERWLSADSALAVASTAGAASEEPLPQIAANVASNARDVSSAASEASSEADYVKVTDADTTDDDVGRSRDQDMQTVDGGITKPLVGIGGKAQQDKPSTSNTGLELKVCCSPTVGKSGHGN